MKGWPNGEILVCALHEKHVPPELRNERGRQASRTMAEIPKGEFEQFGDAVKRFRRELAKALEPILRPIVKRLAKALT